MTIQLSYSVYLSVEKCRFVDVVLSTFALGKMMMATNGRREENHEIYRHHKFNNTYTHTHIP